MPLDLDGLAGVLVAVLIGVTVPGPPLLTT
jgi:hypothetical protein